LLPRRAWRAFAAARSGLTLVAAGETIAKAVALWVGQLWFMAAVSAQFAGFCSLVNVLLPIPLARRGGEFVERK
jgi:hypothetical protein